MFLNPLKRKHSEMEASDAHQSTPQQQNKRHQQKNQTRAKLHQDNQVEEEVSHHERMDITPKDNNDNSTKKRGRKFSHPILQHSPYENLVLTDPTGDFLAYIPRKRFQWYQTKNLATRINEHTIQLKFHPKKKSVDAFQRENLRNICVICGVDEHLTRHHIVPYEYRRNLFDNYKSRNSHDIVVICTVCHADYEKKAASLKKDLSEQYQAPIGGEGKEMNPTKVKIKKLASALINARDRMPPQRRQQVEDELNELVEKSIYLDTEREETSNKDQELEGSEAPVDNIDDSSQKLFNEEYLRELATIDVIDDYGYTSHGEILVNAMLKQFNTDAKRREKIHEFVVMWRKHFLDHTNPKYMSKHWDLNRPVGDAKS